jgi:hypothetical protein
VSLFYGVFIIVIVLSSLYGLVSVSNGRSVSGRETPAYTAIAIIRDTMPASLVLQSASLLYRLLK